MKKLVPFLLLFLLFVAAAWYSFIKEPDKVHELPPPPLPPTMPVVEDQAEAAPLDEDIGGGLESEPVVAADPLLSLNESDPQFTQSLTEIVGVDAVAEYLIKSQAISRLVATIDSLTSRQIPPQINPVKPPADNFVVDTETENTVMSPQNFARYDGYVELLQNVDSAALMTVYQRYSPLFQQAWEENGGEGSFNDRLASVIDNLLDTPDVPGPVYLIKPEAVYLFEDPALEAMTAGQKILVRMGAANASVVKEKLTEVREALNP